jgi:ribosomal protein L7/L12
MPSPSTKNVITAAVAIVKMTDDARETLLLTILEKNPTACIAAMSENGITFGDKATYKVVVTSAPMDRKIAVIKMFRSATGAGLADSKGWSEGLPYNDLPAGVIYKGLTKADAEAKLALLKAPKDSMGYTNNTDGINLAILRDDAPYVGLKMMNHY